MPGGVHANVRKVLREFDYGVAEKTENVHLVISVSQDLVPVVWNSGNSSTIYGHVSQVDFVYSTLSTGPNSPVCKHVLAVFLT